MQRLLYEYKMRKTLYKMEGELSDIGMKIRTLQREKYVLEEIIKAVRDNEYIIDEGDR
jgi:hypothetical protein